MSLASSSGDRVPAEGVAGAISRTGASLVRGRSLGIGSVGCTRHPSKKYIPGKGRIFCSGSCFVYSLAHARVNSQAKAFMSA